MLPDSFLTLAVTGSLVELRGALSSLLSQLGYTVPPDLCVQKCESLSSSYSRIGEAKEASGWCAPTCVEATGGQRRGVRVYHVAEPTLSEGRRTMGDSSCLGGEDGVLGQHREDCF